MDEQQQQRLRQRVSRLTDAQRQHLLERVQVLLPRVAQRVASEQAAMDHLSAQLFGGHPNVALNDNSDRPEVPVTPDFLRSD